MEDEERECRWVVVAEGVVWWYDWWVVVVKGVAVSKGLFYFIFKIKGILDIFKRWYHSV